MISKRNNLAVLRIFANVIYAVVILVVLTPHKAADNTMGIIIMVFLASDSISVLRARVILGAFVLPGCLLIATDFAKVRFGFLVSFALTRIYGDTSPITWIASGLILVSVCFTYTNCSRRFTLLLAVLFFIAMGLFMIHTPLWRACKGQDGTDSAIN